MDKKFSHCLSFVPPKKKGNTYFFLTLPSTQDKTWELASLGAPAGTLVISRTQDAGRGRQGRVWYSPVGGLWFSLLIFPIIPETVNQVTLLSAQALASAIEKVTGLKTRMKLPNDLYCEDKKLAGIILEVKDEKAVLGVGLNVNCRTDLFPSPIPAVSLKEILNHRVSRSVILGSFLICFQRAAGISLTPRAFSE
ncbi:MAG: biotin--[acetyl-CoA-carboxylase] ligase [Candidatus Omnitrophota bacterium]